MTPGARLAAAADCLEAILAGTAAEKALTGWARRSRFAGSKDRAAVRDHVFDILRQRDSCAILGQGTDARALVIGLCALQELNAEALFGAGKFDLAPLTDAERASWASRAGRLPEATACWNMPDAAKEALSQSLGAQAQDIARALGHRAPVDLRVNLRKASRESVAARLAAEGIATQALDLSPTGLRITDGARKLRASRAYADGDVELQDVGSQALVDRLVDHIQTRPVHRILDYCAGGGGKSLALAAQSDAYIAAHDVTAARMSDIPARAARAGVRIACLPTDKLADQAPFDLVFCDAPCTGSGAWRRSPDAKWRFGAQSLEAAARLQSEVLTKAAQSLTPTGTLAYATCSLFAQENDQIIDHFLARHPRFRKALRFQLTLRDGSDGFFLSIMDSIETLST